MNVRRPETLIFAVMPFDQVPIGFRPWPKTGQVARPRRALQRAGKHLREFQACKPFPKAASVTFAARCQWQIGEPGMLSAERPCGLAVPGEVDDLRFLQQFLPQMKTGSALRSIAGADLLASGSRLAGGTAVLGTIIGAIAGGGRGCYRPGIGGQGGRRGGNPDQGPTRENPIRNSVDLRP